MIIAKRINLYRNILGYKFVWRESKDNLYKLEKEIINLISKDFEKDKNTPNLLIYKNNKDLTIKINDKNHITISIIDFSNDDLVKILDKTFEIEKEISANFNIAFSKKFGYLTPYLKYIPHALEIEYFIILQYSEAENIKDMIINNLKDQGHYIEEGFKITKINIIPTYQEKLKDFLNKVQSTINTLEEKEIDLFEKYFHSKKAILLDKINKTKGYILNSNLMEYNEALDILIFLFYISLINENLKREDIARAIFNLKKSNKTLDLKQNSKKLKQIVKI